MKDHLKKKRNHRIILPIFSMHVRWHLRWTQSHRKHFFVILSPVLPFLVWAMYDTNWMGFCAIIKETIINAVGDGLSSFSINFDRFLLYLYFELKTNLGYNAEIILVNCVIRLLREHSVIDHIMQLHAFVQL